ncbi:hypothetical protein [Raineyella fluvialis]|uniref:Frag1/DRAM/Sfk1 family protein n=1 Tax=Raineyella fluvialis TaxID=2662261 RepID=A0A5Q2FCE6_9ACTN|nr:hypothetical protein [Raineyella fluvialis]QGF24582.1 hypothetical protein Rai3103_14125 [Raineyella fluvialis]
MESLGRSSDGEDGQRTLRILIFAPISLLALAIIVFSILAGRLNDSISAYYGGPTRDVFVGCMLATAMGIIAFRGTSDLEDFALNAAGFYAPFVAFVPYDFDATTSSVHLAASTSPATALRAILVCYLVVALVFAVGAQRQDPWPLGRLWHATSTGTRLLLLGALLALVAYLGLVIVRLVEVNGRFAGVHLAAAVLLITNLGVAVASHVVAPRHKLPRSGDDDLGPGTLALYRALTLGMLAGGPLLWAVLRLAHLSSALLWTETLELGLFMVFWASEIKRHSPRLDHSPARRQRSVV